VLLENPRLWILLALGGVGITALVAYFEHDRFLKGLISGVGITLTGAAISHLVMVLGGTGPLMAGELAEQWTANALRPMREHGWKLANHVLFNGGDVDHVLVGPGGVLVVETKWRRDPWRTTGPDFDRDAAIRQVQEKARSVALLLKPIGVVPHPIVVRWRGRGSSAPDSSTSQVVAGTSVVPGSLLEDWALRRGRNVLTPEQVESAWGILAAHAVANEEYEDTHAPVPMSLDALIFRGFGAVLTSLITFVLLAWVISYSKSLIVWLLVSAGLVAGRYAARTRVPARYRLFINSVAIGAAASPVLVSALLLYRSVT
jgi:hypothetical protein